MTMRGLICVALVAAMFGVGCSELSESGPAERPTSFDGVEPVSDDVATSTDECGPADPDPLPRGRPNVDFTRPPHPQPDRTWALAQWLEGDNFIGTHWDDENLVLRFREYPPESVVDQLEEELGHPGRLLIRQARHSPEAIAAARAALAQGTDLGDLATVFSVTYYVGDERLHVGVVNCRSEHREALEALIDEQFRDDLILFESPDETPDD